MIDDSEVAAAWRGCVLGTGNRLLEATTSDASRNSRRSSFLDDESEGEVHSPSPVEVSSSFVHILHHTVHCLLPPPSLPNDIYPDTHVRSQRTAHDTHDARRTRHTTHAVATHGQQTHQASASAARCG